MGHNVGEKLRQRKLWFSFLTLASLTRIYNTGARKTPSIESWHNAKSNSSVLEILFPFMHTVTTKKYFKFCLWRTVRTFPTEWPILPVPVLHVCIYSRVIGISGNESNQVACVGVARRRILEIGGYYENPRRRFFLHISNVTDSSVTRNTIIRDLTLTVYIKDRFDDL